MNAKDEFIGYSVGLDCFVGGKIRVVKVEFSRTAAGNVKLSVVSGHSLELIPGRWTTYMGFEAYQDRPTNKVDQAVWALSKLGLKPAVFEDA